jgi:hypothetical protein
VSVHSVDVVPSAMPATRSSPSPSDVAARAACSPVPLVVSENAYA